MAATTRIEKRAVEVTKGALKPEIYIVDDIATIALNDCNNAINRMPIPGMKNTDLWLPADREPYLKHYSNEFFKKQWADIMDTAEE